ncbi:acetyltransferase [Winogradskyella sp.]|uniref:acetyltransferase n=1 Tax=Winogradskyella sp. TaxID=1883156 RepID=UPI0035186715
MKNILIYGASGHAKMIVDIILKNNTYNFIGFVDSYKPIGEDVYGYKVLGNLELLPSLINKFDIQGIVIGIGSNTTRLRAYKNIIDIAPDLEFVPIVHPTAVLANGVIIPEGTVIMPGAIVNADARVGRFCLLNTKSSLGHDSTMSDFSSLASGATIGGNVEIGFCSAICLSASVAQNTTIGNYTTIGACSLVLKPIGDHKLAFGVPINTIKDKKKSYKHLVKKVPYAS